MNYSTIILSTLIVLFSTSSGLAIGPYTDRGIAIYDQATGLEWQKNDDGIGRSWQNALDYCENASFDNQDDWRLPNIKELQSILDLNRDNPAIDPAFQCRLSWYWSSTTSEIIGADRAWNIRFTNGNVSVNPKTDNNYVRCVRNGATEYTVNPIASSGGNVAPSTPQSVEYGSTIDFTVTPDNNCQTDTVTGCDGSLSGNIYTTGEIINNCTVTASFSCSNNQPPAFAPVTNAPGGTDLNTPLMTSDTTPTFSWEAVSEQDAWYWIGVLDVTTGELVFGKNYIEETSYTRQIPMQQGHTYFWDMTACNDYGCANWSSKRYFTISNGSGNARPETTKPGHYGSPPGKYLTDTTPSFSWSSSNTPDHFKLSVLNLDTRETQDVNVGNVTSYSSLTLDAGEYEWTVSACSSDNSCGEPSTVRFFKIVANGSNNKLPPPSITYPSSAHDTPRGLEVNDGIGLQWLEPLNNDLTEIVNYNIIVTDRTAGTNSVKRKKITGSLDYNDMVYSLGELVPGHSYEVKVQSCSHQGCGYESDPRYFYAHSTNDAPTPIIDIDTSSTSSTNGYVGDTVSFNFRISNTGKADAEQVNIQFHPISLLNVTLNCNTDLGLDCEVTQSENDFNTQITLPANSKIYVEGKGEIQNLTANAMVRVTATTNGITKQLNHKIKIKWSDVVRVRHDGNIYNLTPPFDPSKPTVILTHGWQFDGIPDNECSINYDDLWTGAKSYQAGGLIKSLTDNINILQIFWPDACKLTQKFNVGPIQGGLAQEIADQLANSYFNNGYNKDIHFIGHSMGTLLNAYVYRYLFGSHNEIGRNVQFTILDHAEQLFLPLGVPAKIFQVLLVNPRPNNPITLSIDNYYTTSGSGVGAPMPDSMAVMYEKELTEPGDLGDKITGEGLDHSGAHVWYRWTMAPKDGWHFSGDSVCNGDVWFNDLGLDASLNPCGKIGWNTSILLNRQSSRFSIKQTSISPQIKSSLKMITSQTYLTQNDTLYSDDCEITDNVMTCNDKGWNASMDDSVSEIYLKIKPHVNTEYIEFDYKISTTGDNELVKMFLNGRELWTMDESTVDGTWQHAPPLYIEPDSKQNTLLVVFQGAGSSNGSFQMKNLKFSNVSNGDFPWPMFLPAITGSGIK